MATEIDWEERRKELVKPDWLAIRTRFDFGFVAALKADVPVDKRFWDGDDKVWLVDPDYIETAKALARRHLASKNGVSWHTSWSILHLQRNAPSQLISCAASCLLQDESREDRRLKIVTAREMLLSL